MSAFLSSQIPPLPQSSISTVCQSEKGAELQLCSFFLNDLWIVALGSDICTLEHSRERAGAAHKSKSRGPLVVEARGARDAEGARSGPT